MQFGKRVRKWDVAENELARAIRARRESGLPFRDFTSANPTLCGFAPTSPVLDDVRIYSPEPMGLRAAREAIAAYYAERGVALSPDAILLTASTSEAYSFLLKLLTSPGDQILVPAPSYPLFDFIADLELVSLAPYHLAWDGQAWRLDRASLTRAVTATTRAVMVVHPNNPTGSYIKKDERDDLIDFCDRHDLALITDEVFFDYAFGPDPSRAPWVASDRVLSFVLNGLSKTLALPHVKLGWIVVEGPPAIRRAALDRLEVISDTYLSVGSAIQVSLPRLLALRAAIQAPILSHVIRRHAHGFADLEMPLPVEGGWSAICPCPAPDFDFATDLARRGVFVHPGTFFGFEGESHVVVSLLAPFE
ncbi:MAG: pyridoxal phosphate-dependent aminotransferase [Deltaproteobacteria bacterium]|nr:pyridoxal phosphate-dependent aminotransferase [Deltaproteobacteria bacterium]